MTQSLRKDLEGQGQVVQETIVSVLDFGPGSAAPWHMRPRAGELLHVIEEKPYRGNRGRRNDAAQDRRSRNRWRSLRCASPEENVSRPAPMQVVGHGRHR